MLKKTVSILIALALIFTIGLTGCNKSSGDNNNNSNTNGNNNNSNNTGSQFKFTKDKLKIGVMYISPINDGGWSNMHYNGIKKMVTELGLDETKNIVKKENVSDATDQSKDVIASLVGEGCNVIIGTSYGYGKFMRDAADKYKDVVFLHCSGEYSNDTNLSNYFGRMYQARFLSGLAAGKKTQTNKIGYVAAQPYSEVIRGLDAFTLGVRTANPNATVKVLWTNSWYEPTTEKRNAETLIAGGCDVIAQHQDSTSAQIAAQEKKVWSIGYNADMSSVAPDAHITAPSWDWSKYYIPQIKALLDGTWKPSVEWPAINTGIVFLSPLKNAAPGTQELIDEYLQKIKDGTFDVFGGREIKDNQGNVKVKADQHMTDKELLTMTWLVEGVEGSVPAAK